LQAGILEGNLQAVTKSRDVAMNDLKGIQTKLADATAQMSLLRTKGENWQRQAEEAQRAIVELKETRKPARAPRKPKIE